MNLYIARDFDGSLFLYAIKPNRYDFVWDVDPKYKRSANNIPSVELNTMMYIDVTWCDPEPKTITLEEFVKMIIIYNGKIFVDQELKDMSNIMNRLSL